MVDQTAADWGKMILSEGCYLFESVPKRGGEQQVDAACGALSVVPRRALLCKACHAIITSTDSRIAPEGHHRHTFFNPQGVVFGIGCFAAAPGTIVFGEPSEEFSWFSGYSWRYAACAKCLQHLGWFFEKTAKEGFWGLIVNKLIEESPE